MTPIHKDLKKKNLRKIGFEYGQQISVAKIDYFTTELGIWGIQNFADGNYIYGLTNFTESMETVCRPKSRFDLRSQCGQKFFFVLRLF